MALDVAQKMAPAALSGIGGALGGAFGKKGGRAGKAVGKAIGGSIHKLFHFKHGGRVHGMRYAFGGKVRQPPLAGYKKGGLINKWKGGPRKCKCKDRDNVAGIRNRNGF